MVAPRNGGSGRRATSMLGGLISLLLLLLVLVAVGVEARLPPNQLRIGILSKPEMCTDKVERGDKISVHCTCAPPLRPEKRAISQDLASSDLCGCLAHAQCSIIHGPCNADIMKLWEDDKELFNSYERHSPVEFTVGVRQIVQGTPVRVPASPGVAWSQYSDPFRSPSSPGPDWRSLGRRRHWHVRRREAPHCRPAPPRYARARCRPRWYSLYLIAFRGCPSRVGPHSLRQGRRPSARAAYATRVPSLP